MTAPSEERFQRREVKYALSRSRLPLLCQDLAGLLPRDSRDPGDGYLVRSLYFESLGLRSLRDKLEGLFDRYKLRVRVYPPNPEPILLEIKRKRGDRILKERARIDREELELLVRGDYGELLARRSDDETVRRFVAAKCSLGAVLPLLVEYRREAFEHPCRDLYLRATLDYDFATSPQDGLLRPGQLSQPFGVDRAILEVKTTGPPPSWLPAIVQRHGLSPLALSKFAFGCARNFAAQRL